jgi:hypothetical protein
MNHIAVVNLPGLSRLPAIPSLHAAQVETEKSG